MSSLIVDVCSIEDIQKHPNADRLSVAKVKGWYCIVGLDQYKIGDLVVFVPPDSIIPDSLIEKYNLEYLKKNGRVGTVKLRGQLSQGLILDLPEGNWKEGDNVADVLGITKWQPPESSFQSKIGGKSVTKKRINPLFTRYTDIENVKNYQNIFQNDDLVVITEKIHGTNARYGKLPIADSNGQPLLYRVRNWIRKHILGKKYEYVYGSHNVQITDHVNRKNYYNDDVWSRIGRKYNLEEIIPDGMVIYGEIYGNGIQDLTYGLDDIDFMVFDIKMNGEYLDYSALWAFCLILELPVVPELYVGRFYEGLLDEFTSGNSTIAPQQIREGCVIKMVSEENHPKVGRKILKSISPDYLLRKNGTEFK